MKKTVANSSLKRCPGCSCGIPAHAKICDYCLALLSFGPEGQWVVDGRVCGSCGTEASVGLAQCPACRAPRVLSCPRCGLETMPLTAGRCPRCQTKREEFFDVCLRESDQRRREERKQRRRGPRVMLLISAVAASLVLALGYSKGHFDNPRDTMFMLFLASLFLVLGLVPYLRN